MVFLDLLPDMEPQDKVDFIWEQSMAHPSRTAAEVMSGLLPSRVARAVVVAGGLNPDEPIIAEQEAVVLAMVSGVVRAFRARHRRPEAGAGHAWRFRDGMLRRAYLSMSRARRPFRVRRGA